MQKYFFKPVVGIDVSKDFHVVSILDPIGKAYCKTFKVKNDSEGFSLLISKIKEVETEYSMKTSIFMESTGVYHLCLFHYLKKNELEANLINPLITNSNKNKDIRKVKNDKKDSFSIAKLAQLDDIKSSSYFNIHIFNLKSLCREYYKTVDTHSTYARKLSADLQVLFPNYNRVFQDITCKTSIAILKKYSNPNDLLSADSNEIIELIKITSKQGENWSNNAYKKLVLAAKDAAIIGVPAKSLTIKISCTLNVLETLEENIKFIESSISSLVTSDDFPDLLKKCITLIKSIPGFSFFSSAVILAEIGDYRNFKKPKQLVAFLGLDTSVNQSGKFKGDKNSISKRGSHTARRALYAAALVSIKSKCNGEFYNPILYKYFHENLINKKPKVALGAIMHKLVNYIFAVLRNQKEYELRSPEIHNEMFLNNKQKQCA